VALEWRFTDLHTPEKISDAYRAVGRFITSMADLDSIASTLLAGLCQMHGDTHDLILQSIDFNRKRELIKSLGLSAGPSSGFSEILRLLSAHEA
jgi:hypothetical protein